ncbi:hypothetical protein [Lacibacter sp. H407]|uniref:hypothetical protein n=1 Tax=Lacibacter sp. H407 TaxID=3133423 RepID=UPI0030C0208E
MKRLLSKLLLFCSPLLVLMVLYFLYDPFKVLRHYNSYYESGGNNYVTLNKDYVSTENFINRYPRQQYTSYVLGNSRSIYYEVNTWGQLTGEPADRCYHFDAYGENLYGVAKKIRFLDNNNCQIKHVLLVIDKVLLEETKNQKKYFRIKHPAVSGESRLKFQITFFKAFLNYAFLKEFIPAFVFSVKPDSAAGGIFQSIPMLYDPVTNEQRMEFLEQQIRTNKEQYYLKRKPVFYKRDSLAVNVAPVIGRAQKKLLTGIKQVFDKHQTNYKIVVSPLYDQLKLAPVDLLYLQELFGTINVFDFSGKNAFTETIENYYEDSHYRPHVADSIMYRIYGQPNENN